MNPRELAWTMLYGSIVGISRHPRALQDAQKSGAAPRRMDEMAREADDALIEWEKRFHRPRLDVPPE